MMMINTSKDVCCMLSIICKDNLSNMTNELLVCAKFPSNVAKTICIQQNFEHQISKFQQVLNQYGTITSISQYQEEMPIRCECLIFNENDIVHPF